MVFRQPEVLEGITVNQCNLDRDSHFKRPIPNPDHHHNAHQMINEDDR